MRNAIDYTKHRKSSLRRIVVCPQCGRKAHERNYRDGSTSFEHRIEYQPPFGAAVVVDHCFAAPVVPPEFQPEPADYGQADPLDAALDACDGEIETMNASYLASGDPTPLS